MFLLGIGSGRSKGSILNHIIRGITALILMSAVALAGDLDKDLIKAAGKGDAKKVLALLQKGADVNAADKLGWTPLKRAAENNKVDVVDLLIENGAMIDTLNGSPIPSFAGIAASGYTALHRAAWDGRTVRAGEKLGQERRESGGPWRSKNRPPEICLRKRSQEERFVGYRRDVHSGAICTRSARGLC